MAVGIVMENCVGGTISNCRFAGLDAGVVSINSSVAIDGNTMTDCSVGVAFNEASKLSSVGNQFVRVKESYRLLQSPQHARQDNIFDRLARRRD